jgi:hypothetical protein
MVLVVKYEEEDSLEEEEEVARVHADPGTSSCPSTLLLRLDGNYQNKKKTNISLVGQYYII